MALSEPSIYSWGESQIFDADSHSPALAQWVPWRNALLFTLYLLGTERGDEVIFFDDKCSLVRNGEEIASMRLAWMCNRPQRVSSLDGWCL